MAANTSHRRVRKQVLDTALGSYGDWQFEVRCGRCSTWRLVPLRTLIDRYGGEHTVMRIINRLRCMICRSPPNAVVMVQPQHDRRIGLIGVGV